MAMAILRDGCGQHGEGELGEGGRERTSPCPQEHRCALGSSCPGNIVGSHQTNTSRMATNHGIAGYPKLEGIIGVTEPNS